MIEGLREAGVEVIECHSSLWKGIEDRVRLASGAWLSPLFWFRAARSYIRLVIRFFRIKKYDVMVVGYPGQFDVYLARLLNLFHNKKICWDILMSIYLVSCERDLDKKNRFTVNMLKRIEKGACLISDLLILESPEYVNWFVNNHHINSDKFRLVPLGAYTPRRKPQTMSQPRTSDPGMTVLYWGGFIKNHGVDVMIRAANILRDIPDINFRFVGSGSEKDKMIQLSHDLGLKNVHFLGFLPDDELDQEIYNADICLGIFGDTPQSFMTIQNKIYECLSMGKPLITGHSPLVSRTFTHEKEIFLCQRNPESLAKAIVEVASLPELRDSLARNGQNVYSTRYTPAHIGNIFKEVLEELVKDN